MRIKASPAVDSRPLPPASADASGKPASFTVGRFIFEPIKTAGAAKAWFCEANGIRISERMREGRLWEYVALRPSPSGSGMQFLERTGYVRKFVSPAAAARAALTEWG